MTPPPDDAPLMAAELEAGAFVEDPPNLAAALRLVEVLGVRVFPVYGRRADGSCACGDAECGSPAKHPMVKGWQNVASADPSTVRAKFMRAGPLANIGIATGAGSGVFVLDSDGEAGKRTLAKLEAEHGTLPTTITVCTARGLHFLFAYDGTTPIRNSAGRAGPGVDGRSDGGFVVAVGSVHASGHVYAWERGRGPDSVGLALMPAWLVSLLVDAPSGDTGAQVALPTEAVSGSRVERWADAALRREVDKVRSASEGTRNRMLNEAAFNLGMLVAGGALDIDTVRRLLLDAARECGLPESETIKTLRSAIPAGMSREARSGPTRELTKPGYIGAAHGGNGAAPKSGGSTGALNDPLAGAEPSPHGDEEHSGGDEAPTDPPGEPTGIAPTDVLTRWASEGPLVRVPTGIEALDQLCRGGLPVPWRVMLVGAPSVGKTFWEVIIANTLARALGAAGACVGLLAIDEDPDDLVVRLLQIAGFSVAQAEARDPSVLRDMASALSDLNIRLYDASHTIESAAVDIAERAKSKGRHGVLCVDSLQSVRADSASATRTARDTVEENVKAIRRVSTLHRLLVITTSEANRASYRDFAVNDQNDLASGAESRAIEFGGQTQLVLRTPKDHPDVVHVKVVKNRRADRGEFWLRLDRDAHAMTACANPANGAQVDQAVAERRRQVVEADARRLMSIVNCNPKCSERALRDAVKLAGLRWGVERVSAAESRLAAGIDCFRLVNHGTADRTEWMIVPIGEVNQ